MRRHLCPVVLLFMLLITANASAATYYVKNGGNDSNTGLSDSQAWATLSKVNNFPFASGDKVYLKCGSTWNEALYIHWSGSSDSNRAIVGAYYMNGTMPVTGVSGSRPTIDGQNTKPAVASDCEGGKCSWLALINVGDGTQYVTIENLEVKNSLGTGVEVRGSHHNVLNNIVHDSRTSCILIYNNASYILVEGNDTYRAGTVVPLGASDHPAMITTAAWGHADNITIRKNIVHEGWGEGIMTMTSSNISVEYNNIYDTGSYCVFICSSRDATVKYNLIYVTQANDYSLFGGHAGGIIIWPEQNFFQTGYDTNYYVYGNMVTGCGPNLAIGYNGVPARNIYVYNNSFIEAYNGASEAILFDTEAYNVYFKNNIIWQTGTLPIVNANPIPNGTGRDIDYNLWSKAPPSSIQGAHDPTYAAPSLVKTTGWTSLTPGSLTGQEFALQLGSPAIGHGVNLGADYQKLLDMTSSSFRYNTFNLVDQSAQGAGWDIGAAISSTSTTAVLPPTELQVLP